MVYLKRQHPTQAFRQERLHVATFADKTVFGKTRQVTGVILAKMIAAT
jgi:hypothetical protein